MIAIAIAIAIARARARYDESVNSFNLLYESKTGHAHAEGETWPRARLGQC